MLRLIPFRLMLRFDYLNFYVLGFGFLVYVLGKVIEFRFLSLMLGLCIASRF